MTELQKAINYYPSLVYALSLMQGPGLVLEFGVQNGGSTSVIADKTSGCKIYGFDTFTGLPEDWVSNGAFVVPKGTFDTSGIVPVIEGVKFYKGLFSDTIPIYLNEVGDIKIDFIHMDCDLYSSCCDVLNGLGHLIIPGTLICFDEWTIFGNTAYNDGEQKAFLEWADKNCRSFEIIDFHDTVSPDRAIIRLTN